MPILICQSAFLIKLSSINLINQHIKNNAIGIGEINILKQTASIIVQIIIAEIIGKKLAHPGFIITRRLVGNDVTPNKVNIEIDMLARYVETILKKS